MQTSVFKCFVNETIIYLVDDDLCGKELQVLVIYILSHSSCVTTLADVHPHQKIKKQKCLTTSNIFKLKW